MERASLPLRVQSFFLQANAWIALQDLLLLVNMYYACKVVYYCNFTFTGEHNTRLVCSVHAYTILIAKLLQLWYSVEKERGGGEVQ